MNLVTQWLISPKDTNMTPAGTLEGLFWAFLPLWAVGGLIILSAALTAGTNLKHKLKEWLRRNEH